MARNDDRLKAGQVFTQADNSLKHDMTKASEQPYSTLPMLRSIMKDISAKGMARPLEDEPAVKKTVNVAEKEQPVPPRKTQTLERRENMLQRQQPVKQRQDLDMSRAMETASDKMRARSFSADAAQKKNELSITERLDMDRSAVRFAAREPVKRESGKGLTKTETSEPPKVTKETIVKAPHGKGLPVEQPARPARVNAVVFEAQNNAKQQTLSRVEHHTMDRAAKIAMAEVKLRTARIQQPEQQAGFEK